MPTQSPKIVAGPRARRTGLAVLAGLALSVGAAYAASLPPEAKAVLALKDTAGPQKPSDQKITAPGGMRLLMVGEKTPEQKSYANVLFDGEGMGRLFAAGIQVQKGSSLSLQNCRLINAPRLHIGFSGDTLSLDHCYMGKIGMAAVPGDHLEGIFVHAGKISYTNDLFDVADSPTLPHTITGILFFKSDGGLIDANIDHCIITGIASLQGNYAIQAAAAGYDLKLTISNTGLQRGTSGYVGVTELKGRVTVVDGGGNYDIDTGRPIRVK